MGPYMRPIPIGLQRGHDLVAAHRLHRHPVGERPDPAVGPPLPRPLARRLDGARPPVRSRGIPCRRLPRTGGARRRTRRTPSPGSTGASWARCSPIPAWRWAFLVGITRCSLLGAMALVGVEWVKVKMLPFDNKSEFQVILNMPEGSALEQHRPGRPRDRRRHPHRTRGHRLPDLRRHRRAVQFQRPGPPLLHAPRRQRGRPPGQPRAQARAQGPEPRHRQTGPAPPSPPSRSGTAPASPSPRCRPGRPSSRRSWPRSTARPKPPASRSPSEVIRIFKTTPGVVDVDWYIEADQPKTRFVIDKEKAALHGISAETIAQTLQIAVGGLPVDLVHLPREKEDVNLVLEVPRVAAQRARRTCSRSASAPATPTPCPNPAARGAPPLVPLRELVTRRAAPSSTRASTTRTSCR